MLKTYEASLNDEAVSVLMAVVEAIINSCILTVEVLNDGNSVNPIRPSNLLTIKESSDAFLC